MSSRLLKTEVTRFARREHIPFSARDEMLDFIDLIPMDHAVLTEAEAILAHARTFDAIQ